MFDVKIEFIQNIELDFIYDTCCFSGTAIVKKIQYDIGQIITPKLIIKGDKIKNGRMYQMYFETNTVHYDHLVDVPSYTFKIIE